MGSKLRKKLGAFYGHAPRRVGSVVTTGLKPVYLLIGLAIGLAVVAVIAGLASLPSGTSAGFISATAQINSFLGLIGLGIAVGLLGAAFAYGESHRGRR